MCAHTHAHTRTQVIALLPKMEKANPTVAPAKSPLAGGKWRLLWSQQSDKATFLVRGIGPSKLQMRAMYTALINGRSSASCIARLSRFSCRFCQAPRLSPPLHLPYPSFSPRCPQQKFGSQQDDSFQIM